MVLLFIFISYKLQDKYNNCINVIIFAIIYVPLTENWFYKLIRLITSLPEDNCTVYFISHDIKEILLLPPSEKILFLSVPKKSCIIDTTHR